LKIIKYTYKFRLKPTKDQEVLLNKHFGSIRWIYNYFLNQRKQEYLNNKKSISYNKQSASLTLLKQQEETEWLKETNSQSLQYSLKCLDQAYQNFFNKRTQFPKFKSKKSKNSFTVSQHVKNEGNMIHFPKFNEGIKMIMEREIKGIIKKATLSKTPTGEYFVSILTEKEYISKEKTGKSVGIDVGIKDFLVLSNGSKVKNHRFLKHYEHQLKKHQKHLSRKTYGSSRYEKQRLKVAKIHEKITNSRMDLIHKTTLNLVKEFDTIYLEDLNVKGMMKSHRLAKSISDVSWGKFIDVLTYKAEWNDKQVIHIDRYFPSSKTCNKCGYVNNGLKLKDREWICPGCGEKLDRDLNAAINIYNEGCRKDISGGTSEYKRRAQIRLEESSKGVETFKEMV
jgi:putative transposase